MTWVKISALKIPFTSRPNKIWSCIISAISRSKQPRLKTPKCNDEHFLKPDQYVSQTYHSAATALSDYEYGNHTWVWYGELSGNNIYFSLHFLKVDELYCSLKIFELLFNHLLKQGSNTSCMVLMLGATAKKR